jgi:hypothetical protein
MQLNIESNAFYLSVSKARSRAAGFFYLSSCTTPVANGAIHILYCVMREVVSSAAEAVLGAPFYTSNEACPLQIALEELGHLQSPTSLTINNANITFKQR